MPQFKKGQSGNPLGRPAKADKFAGEIARAEARIARRLVRYIANMEALADGVLVEETNPVTLKTQVYQRPPDRQANEYLINRILGKPIERQEIAGADGGPIQIAAYDYNTSIAAIAARSGEDSDPSGEDARLINGPALGQVDDGRRD